MDDFGLTFEDMNRVVTFLTEQAAEKGLGALGKKIIDRFKSDFGEKFAKFYKASAKEFEKKYPDLKGKKVFYQSSEVLNIILESKFLSETGIELKTKLLEKIEEINTNPEFTQITEEQIIFFLDELNNKITSDDSFRKSELDEFYKERIFDVYVALEQLREQLNIKLTNSPNEQAVEKICEMMLKIYEDEIEKFEPISALRKIKILEEVVQSSGVQISRVLESRIIYNKARCLEATEDSEETLEKYVQAYTICPQNFLYKEKALTASYLLEDSDYKNIKVEIEAKDRYHPICWAINVLDGNNLFEDIKVVPLTVLKNNRFKRFLYSNLFVRDKDKYSKAELYDTLEIRALLSEPLEQITYSNFHKWTFINLIREEIAFNNNVIFLNKIPITDKSEWNSFYELTKLIHEAIDGKEMKSSYNRIHFHYYWLESELAITPSTLLNLKESFSKIIEPNSFEAFLYANSVQKYSNDIEEALTILEAYPDNPCYHWVVLKMYLDIQSKSSLLDTKFDEYLQALNRIGLQNEMLLNVCMTIVTLVGQNLIDIDQCIQILEKTTFEKETYKELFNIVAYTWANTKKKASKEQIDNIYKVLKGEITLNTLFIEIYFFNEHYRACIHLAENVISQDIESQDLFIYMRALYNSKLKDNLEKLLPLLKDWRTKFSFNEYLLRMEIDLQHQILNDDWQTIEEIAAFGLKKEPKNQVFLWYYLKSLIHGDKKDEIEKLIPKILIGELDVNYTLAIAEEIENLGFKQEAIEMYYRYAEESDTRARKEYYFAVTRNNMPFKIYDTVEEGLYVEFSSKNSKRQECIDARRIKDTNSLIYQALGKKLHETFTRQTSVSFQKEEITISKIWDKYEHLHHEIGKEMDNPINDYSAISVHLPSDSDTGFHDALEQFKEKISLSLSIQEEEANSQLQQYLNHKLSFTRLANSNFGGNLVDAYRSLTGSHQTSFCIAPLRYYSGKLKSSDIVVIDFITGLLFYDLNKELGLSFSHKFRISPNILRFLDETIKKITEQKSENFKIFFIKEKNIIRHYPEEFYEERIQELRNIKKWFKENCYYEVIKERLAHLDTFNDSIPTNVQILLDNVLLLTKDENHMLVSDELANIQTCGGTRVFSSEKYLTELFPEKKKEIVAYLLSKRFLGITLDAGMLFQAFTEHLYPKKEYIFEQALKNLALNVKDGVNQEQLRQSILFLKNLSLGSLPKHIYAEKACDLFIELLRNNKNLYGMLTVMIGKEFYLLPEDLFITLDAIKRALLILVKS